MRLKIAFTRLAVWMIAVMLLATAVAARAEGGDIKLEAQLIWATNDKADPNPKHKPVAPDIQDKLNQLPLKWANYFEVNKLDLDIPKGGSRKAKLSDKCEVEIKNLDGTKLEVALFSSGKADSLWKRTQALPTGEVLVLGGNAPNSTAWLVALKRGK